MFAALKAGAACAQLNSSGIHESVQVQTAKEQSGPGFQDSHHQLFHSHC